MVFVRWAHSSWYAAPRVKMALRPHLVSLLCVCDTRTRARTHVYVCVYLSVTYLLRDRRRSLRVLEARYSRWLSDSTTVKPRGWVLYSCRSVLRGE
jgi:hypothetical protein